METACTEAWIRYTNLRSTAAGSLSTTSTSEQSCLAECLGDTACVFVDYVTATQQCWIHTNAADLSQMATSTGINQFVLLRRCSPSERKYHLTVPLPRAIVFFGRPPGCPSVRPLFVNTCSWAPARGGGTCSLPGSVVKCFSALVVTIKRSVDHYYLCIILTMS